MQTVKRYPTQVLAPKESRSYNGGVKIKDSDRLTTKLADESRFKTGMKSTNSIEATINLGYSKKQALERLSKIFESQDKTKEEAIRLANSQIYALWDKELIKARIRFINYAKIKGYYPKNLAEALCALGFDKIKAFLYLRTLNEKYELTEEQADALAREEIKQYKMPRKKE